MKQRIYSLRGLALAGLLSLCLAGCASLLPPPISRFDVQTPRPFGYLIGDEIHHRIIINTRNDVKLNANSVPAKGELNRWLNLNEVSLRTDSDSGDTVIDLTYQVFYAPNEVKMLSIPGFNLQFTQAGQSVEQAVPAWPFTLSPVKELAVRKDEQGRQYMRPDVLPESLSTTNHWLGFYAGLTAAAMLGGYLSVLYGLWPVWPKRRIFKRLLSRLERLPEQQRQAGLTDVHHAFNQLHGKPLFANHLSAFFHDYPQYRAAADGIAWFYAWSDRVLFGGQAMADGDWDKLRQLCRLCRDIECGKR